MGETAVKRGVISVILPVYNVAGYLDCCMESVAGQTYENLEILLVNDGSGDNSLEKCLLWQEKDKRVRVIDQENRGVAMARNAGIDAASGEYLCFIDPDDWVEKDYCEKLLSCLEENGADYAECDLWRYDNRTGKKIYRAAYGKMGIPFTLREHMKYGPTALYKALSRRSLWDKYRIRMPDCSFESPAIYSLLLALSGKVANVREPLYYYRRFREASLIESGYARRDGSADLALGIEAMRFLIGEYKRCGIYEEYKDTLEGVVKYRLSDILAMQYHRRSPGDYKILVSNCRKFLEEEFPEGNNSIYLIWGGYNLNKILGHLDILQDPDCRVNFSSIISLLYPAPVTREVTHKNAYRRMMVARELRQDFYSMAEERKPEYLFMDFIEERFDILDLGGRYITLSDAFSGVPDRDSFHGRVIPRESRECGELWQASFEELLRRLPAETRLILVENYLSEKVGNSKKQREFENLSEIRKTNRILAGYYRYVKDKHPEIPVISVRDLPLYFTDEEYEYGAVPSHLNEPVNMQIAARIAGSLQKR